VPLSEHEQRLLEQIEQALYAEDPKFAHTWRSRDLHSIKRARLIRAILLLVVGLGLLVGGVIAQSSNTVLGVALGVAGFLLMLGAVWYAVGARQRTRAPAAQRVRSRGSLVERLEERWQRRQEGGR
jgi:hypothetical protein